LKIADGNVGKTEVRKGDGLKSVLTICKEDIDVDIGMNTEVETAETEGKETD
jgi:hypothetical protein